MLDAAGEAFARHGFHGASMDAIAQGAGISKPMLYNYFGSKEGLYAAYLERSGSALLAVVRDAAPTDAPATERLEAGVLAFLTYVEEHREGWSVLYNEAVSQAGVVAQGVAAVRDRLTSIIGRSLSLGDEVDETARSAYAAALTGAGESLANWWLENPDQPKEQVAAIFVRLATATGAAASTARPRSPCG
jgi:AcrR family transcriptional regulator